MKHPVLGRDLVGICRPAVEQNKLKVAAAWTTEPVQFNLEHVLGTQASLKPSRVQGLGLRVWV